MGPIGCAETTVRNYTILRCVKSQKMALVRCASLHRVSRIHEYRKDRAIKIENEMGGACSAYEGEQRCLQDFGEET